VKGVYQSTTVVALEYFNSVDFYLQVYLDMCLKSKVF